MQNDATLIRLIVLLLVLFASTAISAVYAWFLERIHHIYSPRQTVLTVIIGDGAILDTLSIIEHQFGIGLTFWIVFWTFVAWGVPIVVWQVAQNAKRDALVQGVPRYDKSTRQEGRA